jgi:fucose permease
LLTSEKSTGERSAALRSRFIPALGMALAFILGVELGGQQISLLYIANEFDLSHSGMGAIVTVQFLAIVMMPAIFGGICDKVGKKKAILAAVTALALGCALSAAAGSLLLLLVGMFVIGAGYSLCDSFMMAALADNNPSKFSQHANLAQCAFCVGSVLSPIAIDSLIQAGGISHRISFVIAACCLMAIAPFLLFAKFSTSAMADQKRGEPLWRGAFSVLKNKVFVVMLVTLFFYVGVEAGFIYFVNSLFTVRLAAPLLGAYAISAFWMMMALSRLVFGIVKTDVKRVVVLSMAMTAAVFAAMSLSDLPALSLILCGIAGGAMGPTWPMLVSAVVEKNIGQSGVTVGVLLSGGALGGVVIPPVMGVAADMLNLSASIMALAVFAFAGVLLFLTVKVREG